MAENDNSKPVVLLVEDDFLQRSHAANILSEAGFTVLEAPTAVRAMNVLPQLQPHLAAVVTDVQMPGPMDGRDLTWYVDRNWPWVRIVVLSGHLDRTPGKFPADARLFDKPISPERLVDALRQ